MFGAAGDVRFEMNPTFERDVLARNPALALMLEPLVRRVEASAKRHARRLSGNLADGIEGMVGTTIVDGISRMIGRVVSKDFKTIWHEKGTRKMSAHPFLEPALAEARFA